MRILDLLKEESIDVHAQCRTKEETIDYLVSLMDKQNNINDIKAYKKAIYQREKLGTTGIGNGIAIPHAQCDCVREAGISVIVIKDGVDFQSLDKQHSYLFFMIAVPIESQQQHLQILAMLSQMLMDEDLKNALIHASSSQEFMSIINRQEKEFLMKEQQKKQEEMQKQIQTQNHYQLLAVTACPTGIAHTYMAADALELKANEMNVSIKIETNGSVGAKNILTKQDIDACEGIIVAADKDVQMERFVGKPVLQVKVADGIHKPEELIGEVLSGRVPIYKKEEKKNKKILEENKTQQTELKNNHFFYTCYKHLMNGINHALVFFVVGGLLLAIQEIMSQNQFQWLGDTNQIALLCDLVGNVLLDLALPVCAGYIAMSIAHQPALIVGFVGGSLACSQEIGFVGALIAGFLAGYIVKGIEKICEIIPDVFDGIKTILIIPTLSVILITLSVVFILKPVLLPGQTWLTSQYATMNITIKMILGAILGIMMAIDMGGPINKIAYVLAIGATTYGYNDMMAAVMVAGMVPPLALGMSTFMFMNYFHEHEQQSIFRNIMMGLCFMSEGAIVFIQEDKSHVLPACLVGSAVASSLSMLFQCCLSIPHGGIFVVGFMTHPLLFLTALGLGTLTTIVLIGFMKKPLK